MFGLLSALIGLVSSIIGGVFRLITSCLGGCFGMVILGVIVVIAFSLLFFGHGFLAFW